MDELSGLPVAKIVDARGLLCPQPILESRRGIADVGVGQVMEVKATDAGIVSDLPAWAKKMGHEYLGLLEEPDHLRLFVRRLK